MTKSFIIAPAERYIFETRFDKAGEFLIKSQNRILGKIIVKKSPLEKKLTKYGENLRDNFTDYSVIKKDFQQYLDKKADKKLRLTIAMKGMREMGGAMEMRKGEYDGWKYGWFKKKRKANGRKPRKWSRYWSNWMRG